MLRSYLPAVVFLCLGTAVGLAFAVLNTYLGPQRPPKVKSKADPYECGLPSDVQQGFRFGKCEGEVPCWRAQRVCIT